MDRRDRGTGRKIKEGSKFYPRRLAKAVQMALLPPPPPPPSHTAASPTPATSPPLNDAESLLPPLTYPHTRARTHAHTRTHIIHSFIHSFIHRRGHSLPAARQRDTYSPNGDTPFIHSFIHSSTNGGHSLLRRVAPTPTRRLGDTPFIHSFIHPQIRGHSPCGHRRRHLLAEWRSPFIHSFIHKDRGTLPAARQRHT